MKHECKQKSMATSITEHEKAMRRTCANFLVAKCGTIINKQLAILTSHTRLSLWLWMLWTGMWGSQNCIEELDFDSCAEKKASCVDKTNSTFYLKRNFDCYQAQQQMHNKLTSLASSSWRELMQSGWKLQNRSILLVLTALVAPLLVPLFQNLTSCPNLWYMTLSHHLPRSLVLLIVSQPNLLSNAVYCYLWL